MSSVINESMTSREMLDILVAKNMEDARQAKKRGELVCWSSSIAPCEFCETMGIHTVYPENHVVGIAARKGAPELLQYAEAKGYSNDICGYAVPIWLIWMCSIVFPKKCRCLIWYFSAIISVKHY